MRMLTQNRIMRSVLASSATFSLPLIAWAQTVPPPSSPLRTAIKDNLIGVAQIAQLVPPGGGTPRHPLDLFGLYLGTTLGFVGIIFVIQTVHGGILWMTAGGNEEQVRKAQDKIKNGAIGAAVVFLAYVVTIFVLTLVSREAGIDGGFGSTTTP